MSSKFDKQIKIIREGVEKGFSANKIQKILKSKGLGMRRKTLLGWVRKIKGVKKKPSPSKYVPRKYKVVAKAKRVKVSRVRVAVYGIVNNEGKRIEIEGNPKAVGKAVALAVKNPPKKKIVHAKAEKLVQKPLVYLNKEEEWDTRPEVES